MGWFDDQIRERIRSDETVLEDSFLQLAGAVLNKWDAQRLGDERLITRQALDEILKYYHRKPVEIPDEITALEEQMEYALRPAGLMVRGVELEKGWHTDACGPMLGRRKDTGEMVALLPGHIAGYWFRDSSTGKKTRVTRRNEKLFDRDAICFYRPLPMKKLKIPDLLNFMRSCISLGDILLISLAMLAVTLVGMLEPRAYHFITGQVLQSGSSMLLVGSASFLAAAAFASQMVTMVKNLLMERIGTKTSIAVESSVMARILSLPVSFFRKYASGDLASRAGTVNGLCQMMLNSILSMGLSSLLSLLYIGQIFQYAPALVWPSILVILSTVILSVVSSFVQMGISRRKMKLDAKIRGMSYSLLNGVQKIRLSGAEKRTFARWGRLYASSARLEYDPPAFLKLNSVLITGIQLIGTIVLYYLAVRSGVTGSEYYAFSAAYGRVSGAFSALAGIAISIAAIPPMLEMAEPILAAEPEVSANKAAVTRLSGSIEMSHISFRYEEDMPWVLEDLSLRIRAGEYVAIVGRTGCGKSTLVRLLLGFEQPEKGAVYYDRHDLAAVDPRSVRKQIGVVIQNGELFQGDLFSNIAISAPNLTMEEAWAAAEMAGIAQDIREMPMGMFTMISEGQGGISGGQKQRLMIARAVAPKPSILILDEATSALDNKTQKQVSEALDGLKCTRIVIAHRLSTIRNCDRILVMDRGAIVEEGNYETLMQKKGFFADLVNRQRIDLPQEEGSREEEALD